MDILNQLMGERGGEMLSALTGAGFSAEQAEKFLPVAGEGIGKALGEADVTALLGASDDPVAGLLDKIDVSGIAARVGLDASLVETGLRSLLPQVLVALQGEGGGVSSLLGGGLGGLLKRGAGLLR